MIGQVQKPFEEIVGYLEGKEKIVLIGCGACATVFHTGGEQEVKKMAETLKKYGKNILAAIGIPFGVFTCYAPMIKEQVDPYRREIEECDAILMMSCGDGLQNVRENILEKEYGLVKPIYPANNALGHMGGGPTLFRKECEQCGECELGRFAGICPMVQCAKGLLNGPCGGAKNGKCEVDPDKDCAWELIYKRLKELEEIDKMKEIQPPKDWSKSQMWRLTVEPEEVKRR
jgi:ferredoxin